MKEIILESRVLYVSQSSCSPSNVGQISSIKRLRWKSLPCSREFIGSKEHHIGEILDTGESQIESHMGKRWIHDQQLEESFVKSDLN
jgi:hypothetical protein